MTKTASGDDRLANLPLAFVFTGQLQHLLFILLLVPGTLSLAQPGLAGGSWLGVWDRQWLLLMIGGVLAHQIVVALVFRLQLVYGVMNRLFGNWDMVVWGIIFLPLLVFRVISLVGLGLATNRTLTRIIPGLSDTLGIVLGLLLMLPALYTLYSVFRYFGLKRALGADHFRAEYRQMALERRGMFRYSSNAMYAYAFLLFWALALLLGSWPALVGALFQHAYIWVHWYCTEAPDMAAIYQ
jgi:hypothetical protein